MKHFFKQMLFIIFIIIGIPLAGIILFIGGDYIYTKTLLHLTNSYLEKQTEDLTPYKICHVDSYTIQKSAEGYKVSVDNENILLGDIWFDSMFMANDRIFYIFTLNKLNQPISLNKFIQDEGATNGDLSKCRLL